jgi:hypothetical protein
MRWWFGAGCPEDDERKAPVAYIQWVQNQPLIAEPPPAMKKIMSITLARG